MSDHILIPEFPSNFELERQKSISFSRENENFEVKTHYLMIPMHIKDETVTPKFVQSTTFTESLDNLSKEIQEEQIGRKSVIKSKTNCLAEYPDINEFFSFNKEKISSAECKCLLF